MNALTPTVEVSPRRRRRFRGDTENPETCFSCNEMTTFGKPYCIDHLVNGGYAQKVARMVADRNSEIESAMRRRPSIPPDGYLARDILMTLVLRGSLTPKRLSIILEVTPQVIEGCLVVLARDDLILNLTLGSRRGTPRRVATLTDTGKKATTARLSVPSATISGGESAMTDQTSEAPVAAATHEVAPQPVPSQTVEVPQTTPTSVVEPPTPAEPPASVAPVEPPAQPQSETQPTTSLVKTEPATHVHATRLPSGAASTGATLKDAEWVFIRATLAECDWNKKLAAEKLGISRSALYAKLKRAIETGRITPAEVPHRGLDEVWVTSPAPALDDIETPPRTESAAATAPAPVPAPSVQTPVASKAVLPPPPTTVSPPKTPVAPTFSHEEKLVSAPAEPKTDEATPAHEALAAIIGSSPEIERLKRDILTVATSTAPVLILGESGVGKELVARAIHALSGRTGKFLAENCGGFSEGLIESELFGHTKGAFTGAALARRGLFERADGGTVFLDEIGEMPLELQKRFLRVLETGRIRPVGGSEAFHVNVRLVAATNQDIEELVRLRQFRRDLYFRMNVVRIEVPPLRNRISDLKSLVAHFLGERVASDEALTKLAAHSWPGNVRELKSVLTRAQMFYRSDPIPAAAFQLESTRIMEKAVEKTSDQDGIAELRDRLKAAEAGLARLASTPPPQPVPEPVRIGLPVQPPVVPPRNEDFHEVRVVEVKPQETQLPDEVDESEAPTLSTDTNRGRIYAHLLANIGRPVSRKALHKHIHTKPKKSTIQSNVASVIAGLRRLGHEIVADDETYTLKRKSG